MRIAVGFDHAGFPLKAEVFKVLADEGHDVSDLGVNAAEPPVDYPDVAERVADVVRAGDADRGIVVCGSGAGVAVAATKVRGVRAVTAHDTYTAHQSVEHDDCNVLCFGARVIGPELAADIMRAYLRAQFTGEERHVRRLAKIAAIEARWSGPESE